MVYLACDIGAASGRHVLGTIDAECHISLQEIYRFENKLVAQDGHLCWDIEALNGHVMEGLRNGKPYKPVSFGIDTWGVDFVLLDGNDQVIGDAVSYRDSRSKHMDERLEQVLCFDDQYRISGIAKQPFNTIYQLMSVSEDQIVKARSFLMIPDYFHFMLTGVKCNEYTNASTTAMLNAKLRTWDQSLVGYADLPDILWKRKLSQPGDTLGIFRFDIEATIGYNCNVVLPATHDTASAFVAVPARDERAVYLSSGTWSLLGVELDGPLTDEASLVAGFTNEGGYAGKIRYLKNIMGLWIVQCVRAEMENPPSFAEIERLAKENEQYCVCFDANASRFLSPHSMIAEIHTALQEENKPLPQTEGQLFSCIFHSLAQCYCHSVAQLEQLTKMKYTSVNIVGGGSQSGMLNQLTADALGVPVYAGPVEASALGNIIVQMLAAGEIPNIETARNMVFHSFEIKRYLPR